jgi:protein TonB
VPAESPERSSAPPPSVASTAPSPSSSETGVARGGGQAGIDAARGRGTAPASGGGPGASGATSAGGGAGGTQVAAVAPGTGGDAGTGVGNEYAAYLARLRQRVQESLRYPATARRRGLTGTVQLEIAIAADGAIAAVSVIASSSHEALDRAAVEAARSLPRAPFPADVRPRLLTVRLPVVFELQ